MTRARVVAVSGSLHHPSKTTALVSEITRSLGRVLPIESRLIRIDELGPQFAGALRRSDLPAPVEDALRAIETADVLIVGTPVYRASFTGLFKHLFDFVDQFALVDLPILLAATGGSERHSLIIEHQLRPLFGFFQALTLPVGVYAHDSDFTDHAVSGARLTERIDKALERALPLIRSSLAESQRIRAEVEAGDGAQPTTADEPRPVRLIS
ncbi:FMN reductase [uncultured Amnibacterium sp.]|uniref:FMN reductase n=1 Tax=uncultured Amnibacterium sp. TaxID=1631851 RepID=UPI0035C9FB14